MKYFKVSKLIRDKIVDNMEKSKQNPRGVRTLKDDEFLKELIEKVIEEAREMQNFEGYENLKEELADVQEVLDYIKKELQATEEEIKSFQKKKIIKNGGFQKRIYVEDVGVEESNDWFEYYDSHPDKYPKLNEGAINMSWKEKEGKLVKGFEFDDFNQAIDFINKVHPIAQKQNHHPDILLHSYNKVKVMIYTHDKNKITEKDHELAREIDQIE